MDEEVYVSPNHTEVAERINKEKEILKKRPQTVKTLRRKRSSGNRKRCSRDWRIEEVRAEVQGAFRGVEGTRQGSVPKGQSDSSDRIKLWCSLGPEANEDEEYEPELDWPSCQRHYKCGTDRYGYKHVRR